MYDAVLVLGKELRRDPARARRELKARAAAAAIAHRGGAQVVLTLEAPMAGPRPSGCDLVAGLLAHLGVPRGAVLAEPATRSTREEALRAHEVVSARGLGRLLVVTSRYHVPRARTIFHEHFGEGRVAVHAPTGSLRGATAEERAWISGGVPGPDAAAQEARLERWLLRAARSIRWLPGPLRWRLEVHAGALLRKAP